MNDSRRGIRIALNHAANCAFIMHPAYIRTFQVPMYTDGGEDAAQRRDSRTRRSETIYGPALTGVPFWRTRQTYRKKRNCGTSHGCHVETEPILLVLLHPLVHEFLQPETQYVWHPLTQAEPQPLMQ